MLKLNKKCKKGFIILRGSTWMRRGTLGHVAAPRAPTRQGDVAYYLHIYFTYYIVHNVQPSVYRKGIQPSKSAFLLNPIPCFNFLRVGLKSHTVFKMQVTRPIVERRIGRIAEDRALIGCARRPP